MAAVAVDSGVVELSVVEWPDPPDAQSLPNAHGTNTLAVGTFVRQDTNGGGWIPALSTAASNVAGARLLLKTIAPGVTGTAIRRGLVDGFNLASQANNASLFVNDTGVMGDAAGTVSITAGRVLAGTANIVTASRDKLASIDLPV